MLQPLQLQEVAARYSSEIAEVRDFLVKAGFTPGKASSLGTVTDRLRQDRTMRRDLTSHVWVVLYTVKASYAELLALVTLAAAGPQFAADADEDEAHELLRFLMGARGEFEGAGLPSSPRAAAVPVAPIAPTPVAPVPVVAAPITPVVAVAPAAVPAAVETPAVVASAPLVNMPTAPAARARFADAPASGNLQPLRKPGDLPPLRWGGSSSDESFYGSEPEGGGRMAIVAVVVCLLAVLLFGVAIWRYQDVQKRQAEVRQQEQQRLQQQNGQDAAAGTHQAAVNPGK